MFIGQSVLLTIPVKTYYPMVQEGYKQADFGVDLFALYAKSC